MSTIDIESGGAVEVDPESLRETAAAIETIVGVLARAATQWERAGQEAYELVWQSLGGGAPRVASLRGAELAGQLRWLAELYDWVERAALQLIAEAEGDWVAGAVLARETAGVAVDPITRMLADFLANEWWDDRHEELRSQFAEATEPFRWVIGPLALWATRSAFDGVLNRIDRDGRGTPTTPLRARDEAVDVELTTLSSGPGTAPQGMVDIVDRIPGEGESRIRVEQYDFPDGSREFAVYVSGMQTPALGGADPFDMLSNLLLYSGGESASSDSVRAALEDAGVTPGDILHLNGYSQGGMIVSDIAMTDEYDVRTLVTIGSPVQVEPASDQTLQVTLRHLDDPVVALSAGGLPGVAGATGSVVVERVASPIGMISDVKFGAHQLPEYGETAAELDASRDSRLTGFQETLDHLQDAESVQVTVYGAERVRESDE